MDREREFTVVVCFCSNRSWWILVPAALSRADPATEPGMPRGREGNGDRGREIERERERVIVTTASSDNRSIRDRSELPAAFPQDRVKRY